MKDEAQDDDDVNEAEINNENGSFSKPETETKGNKVIEL